MSDEKASFGTCVSPLFLAMGGESLPDRIVVAIVLELVLPGKKKLTTLYFLMVLLS